MNPYRYLTFLFEHQPNEKMSDDELEQLAPWNENVKTEIYFGNGRKFYSLQEHVQLGITEEKFKNYSDTLSMYSEKAIEALSKLLSDIAQKIRDGAVDLTTFIGDGNEKVVEADKSYEKWADKVTDCKQEFAELKIAIRQLELEKINNIMEDFTNQFDLREDGKDLISKQVDLLKKAGQLVGGSFFTTQIDQSKKQLAILEEEKTKLAGQMASAISSGRVNYNALTCSNAG